MGGKENIQEEGKAGYICLGTFPQWQEGWIVKWRSTGSIASHLLVSGQGLLHPMMYLTMKDAWRHRTSLHHAYQALKG